MFTYLVEEKARNLNLNPLSCFLKGCQLPSLYIFIYVTIYISISCKYTIVVYGVVVVFFLLLRELRLRFIMFQSSLENLFPYKAF